MYTMHEEQKAAGAAQRQNIMLCFEKALMQQSCSLDDICDFVTLYFQQGSAI